MKIAKMMFLAIFMTLGVSSCSDPLENVSKANTSDAKDVTTEDGDQYKFSNEGSTVGWTGTKTGGKHDGGFNDFEGHVVVSNDEVKQVDVTIQIASIWTDNDDDDPDEDKLKDHLLSKDFFAAKEYPTARFVSTSITKGGDGGSHTVVGNLTMRDKTKSITFPADIKLDGDTVTASAEFKIDRMDWGVEFKIPGGEVILHNDVALRLDIKTKK